MERFIPHHGHGEGLGELLVHLGSVLKYISDQPFRILISVTQTLELDIDLWVFRRGQNARRRSIRCVL